MPIVAVAWLSLGLTLAAGPAAAQGELGAGVSFMSGEGETGPGVVVDYSQVFRPMTAGGTLGWVGDFSLHSFSDQETRILTFMGGVRYARPATERLTWFAQGLLGLGVLRATGDLADACDFFDLDCNESQLAFAPGGGILVPLTERLSLRAQIDFVTVATEGEAGNFRRFWFGVSLPFGAQP